MNQVGEITIRFKKYSDGVYYYDFTVEIEGSTRNIVLPRYHTLVGWIEIFGLPPQNEWVVLADVEPFSKQAVLEIDGVQFQEQCVYTTDVKNKIHSIEVTRTSGNSIEQTFWNESYKNAPDVIKNTIQFTSTNGDYQCTMEKSLVTHEDCTGQERGFIDDTTVIHGQSKHIWQKTFSAKGTLPEVYYAMFPKISGIDLTNLQGSVIEIGYMKGDEGVDAVHGDWYKRFQLGDQVLYVTEGGYTSRVIETKNGPEKIKDTYHKKLYR